MTNKLRVNGKTVITEGKTVKGGVLQKPTTPRPVGAPPAMGKPPGETQVSTQKK